MSNEAIQWIFKCQMGRLLYVNGVIQWIFKCQMRRFNGFLSVKWGDYYMTNEVIHYYMPNGALKLLCQLEKYTDHGLFAFHASASTLSLAFVPIIYFRMMNILN